MKKAATPKIVQPARVVFDLGGTHLRVGRVEGEELVSVLSRPTPQRESEGVELLARLSSRLMDGQTPSSIIGGVAGTLNAAKSKIVRAPNLPNWVGHSLATELRRLSPNVSLENDAAVAGFAEARQGGGRGYARVAFITVGTGLGGHLIVNGKIHPSRDTDEPGRWKISLGGKKREWEEWISGASIDREYYQAAAELKDLRVWSELRERFTIGLGEVVLRWRPDVIVLGGSVMKKLWPLGQDRAERIPVHLCRSRFGDRATLRGALLLGLSKNFL